MTRPRFGDFDYRTVTGAWEPSLADIDPTESHFGVDLSLEYVYGFLTGESGTVYCPEQKFAGSLSSGTYVMTNAGGAGNLDVHPITSRTYRGEVRRTVTEDGRRWADPVMLRLPAHALRDGDLPYTLELSGRDLVWDQGELLHLEGSNKTLGTQFFSMSKDEPLFYASLPYWVTGTFLGEPASGLLFFDRCHAARGREWKETAMFADLQICWAVFGNAYTDGSVEFGHIVRGKQGFNAGVVVENDELLAGSSVVDARFWLDGAGFIDKATFGLGNREWLFAGDDAGKMAEFSASRWNNYRAQFGTIRRSGDDRVPVSSFTWMESFADRMETEGLLV